MTEQLILQIAADGTVRAETKGITGPKCLDSIQLLEELLEATAVASEFTADYTRSTAATRPETTIDDDLHH